MAWQQNNPNQQNNFNNSNGEKKKTNFRVGRIYGADGKMEVSIWNSDRSGVLTTMNIIAAVGKDPSNNANVYLQKMPNELPSIYLNTELLRAFLDVARTQSPESLNFTIDTTRGAKITVMGSSNSVKITIENSRTGPGTITFNAVPAGSVNVHANWKLLIDLLEICYKKATRTKLDPEEFGMALSDDSNNMETPF